MSFQLLDKAGATKEDGTIEEWWSPTAGKRIYSSPSYSSTEIRRDKDHLYRTKGQIAPPYLLQLLRDEVVHPLADDAEMEQATPDLRVQSFGQVKLDCIMLDHPIANVAYPPLGLFPTYCLNPDNDQLRISVRYASENVIRNSLGTFQGRGVPIDSSVSISAGLVAKSHVSVLAGVAQDDSIFEPSDDLELQSAEATSVPGKVIAGKKLSGDIPRYPPEDKRSRTEGAVRLHAVIGTDGLIHQLSVVDTPSPTLALSALAAVRTWAYQPYLLNGLPCSVDTTITVNYKMGPG